MAFIGMEWIVAIVAIVLFLFGAKKIPEFAKGLGKASGEFRRGRMMVEKEMRAMESEMTHEPQHGSDTFDDDGTDLTSRDETISPIQAAARELGIDTEGRSEPELKELIKARVTGEAS